MGHQEACVWGWGVHTTFLWIWAGLRQLQCETARFPRLDHERQYSFRHTLGALNYQVRKSVFPEATLMKRTWKEVHRAGEGRRRAPAAPAPSRFSPLGPGATQWGSFLVTAVPSLYAAPRRHQVEQEWMNPAKPCSHHRFISKTIALNHLMELVVMQTW